MSAAAPAPARRLLTFAPMIDSELCRFLLWHYDVAYREEPHIFGWGSLLALWRGGTVRVPLLHGARPRMAGPRRLVEHFDATCAPERKLIPAAQPLGTQVEADWNRFNGELAGHTAVLAYFHLLPHPEIMLEPFSRGVPDWEAAIETSCYPLQRRLFALLLQLGPGRAEDALTRIRMAFEGTDARLADGRPYLAGDRLTLSDLSFATAAAPMLLPAGARSPIPPLERMPAELQAIVAEMRQHPTAAYVQRIFDLRERSAPAAPPAAG